MRLSLPIVLLAAALLLLVRLGARPVTDSAEERVADVAAHMVESGDWVVPIHDGEVRLRKPPLAYWLAAAGRRLLPDPLAGSRLASALAGLALLALTAAWAGRAAGGAAGPLAALLLLSMLLFEKEGRRATMEMPLALACNAALFLFAGATPLDRRTLVLFGLSFALAFLAKGTPALLVVGLPIALVAFLERERRPDALAALAVIPVALLPTVAWYLAVARRVPDGYAEVAAIVLQPLGAAARGGGATHYEPPWWYLEKIVGAAFPVSLLLPVAIGRAVRTRLWRGRFELRFLALVFLAGFVGFSLVPQKQKHYLLPLLPALAILTAESVRAAVGAPRPAVRRAVRILGLLLLIACAFGVVALYGFLDIVGGSRWGALLAAAVLGLWLLGAARAVWAGDPARAARALVPLILLLLFARLAFLEVWRDRVKDAYDHRRTLPQQEVLLRLHENRSPWLKVLGVEKKVRRTARRLQRQPRDTSPHER